MHSEVISFRLVLLNHEFTMYTKLSQITNINLHVGQEVTSIQQGIANCKIAGYYITSGDCYLPRYIACRDWMLFKQNTNKQLKGKGLLYKMHPSCRIKVPRTIRYVAIDS